MCLACFGCDAYRSQHARQRRGQRNPGLRQHQRQAELDAATVAGGVAFTPVPDWDINLGVLKTFYGDATTSTGIFYEKDVVIISLGIQHKFF